MENTNLELKPVIGITMGDPAGVGPEITVKALSQKQLYTRCRPLVVGDADVLALAQIGRASCRERVLIQV